MRWSSTDGGVPFSWMIGVREHGTFFAHIEGKFVTPRRSRGANICWADHAGWCWGCGRDIIFGLASTTASYLNNSLMWHGLRRRTKVRCRGVRILKAIRVCRMQISFVGRGELPRLPRGVCGDVIQSRSCPLIRCSGEC